MFMGAMMLIVLPLFLIVSARSFSQNEFGKSPGGKIVAVLFYMFAAFCLFGLVLLIAQIIDS